MKRFFVFSLVIFFCIPGELLSQQLLAGRVFDKRDEPIIGANIFIEGTYSGTSSNVDGSFSFKIDETGKHFLIVRYIGYDEIRIPLFINDEPLFFSIEMKEAINKIEAVTITAGSFEASGENKREILKELDIVTTAGATGDIAGVLNTLPGTQTVGEDGKLYVRGGDSYETKTFIDGMRVVSPYYTAVPYAATRNRFSPFMFKGTSFSTGGYSAEYGQGLSSALILSTKEKADQTRTDLTIIPFGSEVAQSISGEKSSIAGKIGYFNMTPYYDVIPQKIDWRHAPESVDGNLILRHKVGDYGMIKAFGNFMWSMSELNLHDIDNPSQKTRLVVDNMYGYLNTSYKDAIGKNWSYFLGTSYSLNTDKFTFDNNDVKEDTKGGQIKLAFTGNLNERLSLNYGVDFFQRYHLLHHTSPGENIKQEYDFNEQILATFAEADIYFSNDLLARFGARSEYNWLNHTQEVDPRISIAYKVSSQSNFSVAYGQFQQATNDDLLRINNKISNEKSSHYIVNYQYTNLNRTFRVEGYYKKYKDLVKYNPADIYQQSGYNNSGIGYAQGVEIFWRDTYSSIKNADYWISYSFLDTKRNYRDFPKSAIPKFASKHNISIAYKQFFPVLKSFVSTTYTYASGRPYHDPTSTRFNSGRTKSYNDLSATIAYMATENIGVFLMSTNLIGNDNVFGYEFGNIKNENGGLNRRAIKSPTKRFIVIGATMTLSKNGVMNQLKTL